MNDPNFELERFPPTLRAKIESELESDEPIVWVGRHNARPYVLQTMLLLVFAVPFTAFAVAWTAEVAGIDVPNFNVPDGFKAWYGIPFILIGLGLCCTPFWAVWIARRTAYVLTDRRAIVFDGLRPYAIRTFLPDRLRDLSRTERSDGSGNLVFLRRPERDSEGDRRLVDYGFMAIPDVKQVEELVRRLVEEHGGSK
jgi:hypothetical protein